MYGTWNFVLYLIVLAVTVLLLCDGEKRTHILQPRIPAVRQILSGVLLWLSMILVIGAVNLIFFHSFTLFQFVRLDGPGIWNFITFQLLVAVTEEVLFRGYLTELGRSLRLPWWIIAVGSAALFGAGHWVFQHDLIQLITASVIGLIFSLLYQRTRSCTVYSLIIAHFLYDISIINVVV